MASSTSTGTVDVADVITRALTVAVATGEISPKQAAIASLWVDVAEATS